MSAVTAAQEPGPVVDAAVVELVEDAAAALRIEALVAPVVAIPPPAMSPSS